MKTLFILLLCCPFQLMAQPDTLVPLYRENLKPIENDLLPAYYGRYGTHVRTQYTYDGLDVRHPKELGQYIFASGDPEAIHEFNAYIGSRKAGGWLIAGGLLGMVIGAPIMLSNKPDADGKFHINQTFQCPAGQYCGTHPGGVLPTIQVRDTQRENAFGTGSLLLLSGAILTGIGWGLNLPGQHLRHAVQYYNRALKQRGISWRLSPYSTGTTSGIGLAGRF